MGGPAFPFDADAGKVFLRSMNTATSRQVSSRQLAVPNLLTYARIAAVPAVVACMYWQNILQGGLWLRWIALAIFVAGAITDFLDGYFGRLPPRVPHHSLAPSLLLILPADDTIKGRAVWAAIVILCREILVSGLREYLAELRVSVPVTQLAKWKTTVQLVAVGFLIAGDAGDAIVPVVTPIGLTLLWCSALLTLY